MGLIQLYKAISTIIETEYRRFKYELFYQKFQPEKKLKSSFRITGLIATARAMEMTSPMIA